MSKEDLGSSDEWQPPRHHPDSHELDDWPLYGPKDGRIADLVWDLAYDHGMRVLEIEAILLKALQSELDKAALADQSGEPHREE